MRARASWMVAIAVTCVAGCRKDAPPPVDAGAPEPLAGQEATDGSVAARDARPRADASRRDAGLDPACEGAELALLAAAADERCASTEREYALLVADAGVAAPSLRQQARREGDRIVFSLVNASSEALLVPLRFQPGERGRAFTVIAEDREHALYELAPPSVVLDAAGDGGAGAASAQPPRRPGLLDAGAKRVQSARIGLPPGGRAVARLIVDPRVVARLHPPCAEDAGACAPARLPPGPYTLHVGQLLTPFDSGPPARVEWERP